MNPAQVIKPTLPPCSNPSGIIVSASMVRMAPAANAWTAATVADEAPPSSPKPAAAAAAEDDRHALRGSRTRPAVLTSGD
jgi:hypothetical protein